jgi:hypothetical protein
MFWSGAPRWCTCCSVLTHRRPWIASLGGRTAQRSGRRLAVLNIRILLPPKTDHTRRRMSARMSKDLALCLPAVSPGDARDLSVAQRELLGAVQATSAVPDIIRISRLPEGMALRELEALLHGGWVIPLNPTPVGQRAVDLLPGGAVSLGMSPSTVKGFVPPDEMSPANTQRAFRPAVTMSPSEQELEAALERLTEIETAPGSTASVFPASLEPKTPQVNTRSVSQQAATPMAPEPRGAAPGAPAQPTATSSSAQSALEPRGAIKAVPIRTVAVGPIKPSAAPQRIETKQPAPAAGIKPQPTQPTQPTLPTKPSQTFGFSLDAAERERPSRPSSPPQNGERRSPIPLPSEVASQGFKLGNSERRSSVPPREPTAQSKPASQGVNPAPSAAGSGRPRSESSPALSSTPHVLRGCPWLRHQLPCHQLPRHQLPRCLALLRPALPSQWAQARGKRRRSVL